MLMFSIDSTKSSRALERSVDHSLSLVWSMLGGMEVGSYFLRSRLNLLILASQPSFTCWISISSCLIVPAGLVIKGASKDDDLGEFRIWWMGSSGFLLHDVLRGGGLHGAWGALRLKPGVRGGG
jgi:hypothetical protein